MGYFNQLPNLDYPSRLPTRTKNTDTVLVKNLFKRAKLRDDMDQAVTAFYYYQIPEGSRPDILAGEVYGDPELDWIILITNNIINVRDQWPLSNNDLNNYILDKYGSSEALTNVHHYETIELKDQYGRILLESGLHVDSDYTFTYSKSDNSIVTSNPVYPVTNYQYEVNMNEEKRRIKILKPGYAEAIISELQDIMQYSPSSQFIDRRTKGTYNPNLSGV